MVAEATRPSSRITLSRPFLSRRSTSCCSDWAVSAVDRATSPCTCTNWLSALSRDRVESAGACRWVSVGHLKPRYHCTTGNTRGAPTRRRARRCGWHCVGLGEFLHARSMGDVCFTDFHQQPAEFLKQTGGACGMFAPPLPVHGARQQIVFIDHAACGLKLSYLAGLQGSSTDEGSVIRHCLPTVWRLLLCMS